jgi:hypothetical protein
MQQIAQDTGRSYCSTRACALYDERSDSIPLRVKRDDIVRSSERGRKRMRNGVS